MIEVEHLVRRFGAHRALDDVSFRVGSGEIAGLLGPNGAGKTTVQRILLGALAPTSGRVSIAGFDALRSPLEVRRRVGYLPEILPLYPELRVDEFLRFRARLKGLPRRSIASACDAAIERCGLEGMRRRLLGALSRGYRLRAGLADAMLGDPAVLILDEPTGGLDPLQRRELLDAVRGWRGEKTVLLSSHILPEIESTCDRVLLLHRGRLLAEGAPRELQRLASGALHLKVELEGPLQTIDWSRLPGVTGHVGRPLGGERFAVELEAERGARIEPAIVAAIERAGGTLLRLGEVEESLEDLFVRIVRANTVLAPLSAPPRGESLGDSSATPRGSGSRAPRGAALRALLGRELASYVRSPLGPALFALVQIVVGWSFYDRLVENPDAAVRGNAREAVLAAFGGGSELVRLWFLILPPLLTMRLFAEERRTGTLEGLLTAPVRIPTIVAGKFLAAWIFFALLFAPGWLYLAACASLGASLDLGLALSQHLGLVALGTVGLSVGTFCSALGASQVVAAAAAFTGNLVLALPWLLRTFLDLDRWSAALLRFDL
ncbi:MAG: ATP-binding cassette domain-containing protein, partial [Planctomycetes bacterium]|nr:ATP-binding cassette domain-containing protein [Planctomycetota bacterium]